MRGRRFALLVHDRPEAFERLKPILRELSAESYSVRTCAEAQSLIGQVEPHLVLTATALADGTWTEMVRLGEQAEAPLQVIVVADAADSRFCSEAVRRGAFALLAPPFDRDSVVQVLRVALSDVRRRREALARSAVA